MELFGLVTVPAYVLVSLVVGILTFIYYRHKYSYFSKRGINGPTPLPLIGTAHLVFMKGVLRNDTELVEKYGKNVGLYEGYPTLLTSDEDVIRDVMVKKFNDFTNRKPLFPTNSDDVFSNMLLNLKDDDWKRVRTTLTPIFTAGKLKQMCKCINETAEVFIENLGRFADDNKEFELKDVAGAFTLDVIARTGFGIAVNSQKDKDDEFLVNIKEALNFDITNPLPIIAIFFPQLAPIVKKMGGSVFSESVVKFFASIIDQAMNERKKGNTTQQDFIQLMLKAHKDEFDAGEVAKEVAEDGIVFDHNKQQSKALSKTEIIAQGFVLFLAGFDTTANGISFLLYCLALHPECQKKAQEEIDRVVGNKKEISYEDASQMTYLHQCFNEAVRLYPPAPRVNRMASNDVTIKGIPIEKDTAVIISIINRHMDPEIWPEPEKYDPDRFSPEEKARHTPFDHMPFGYGPRSCIAMRLALLEVKLAAALVLKNYTVMKTERTEVPLTFMKGTMTTRNGIWLKLCRRNEE